MFLEEVTIVILDYFFSIDIDIFFTKVKQFVEQLYSFESFQVIEWCLYG